MAITLVASVAANQAYHPSVVFTAKKLFSCLPKLNKMRLVFVTFFATLAIFSAPVAGQFFNALRNIFSGGGGGGGGGFGLFGGGGRFTDDGTQSPQASANDKLFPEDCGRDTRKGTGKLCFPVGNLCAESK